MNEAAWMIVAGLAALTLGAMRIMANQTGKLQVKDKTLIARGVSYRMTDADLLWLARMILGESGADSAGGAAVAFAIANNFMLVQNAAGKRPRFNNFTACIRAYSSVLSPRWATIDAPGCQEHPANCTAAQLRRRTEITAMPWERIPPKIQVLVQSFADGKLRNRIGNSVDWASHTFAGASAEVRGNYFGTQPFRRVVS